MEGQGSLMADTCDWCGDPIHDDAPRIEVVTRSPGGLDKRNVLAQFHSRDERLCYSEARDHGWRD